MKYLTERFSKRTVKMIFAVLALITLSATSWNALNILFLNVTSNDECAWRPIADRPGVYLITDVVPGGVTDKAGIKSGDILLKLNGQELITTGNNQNAMNIVNAVKKGDYCTYLVERGGKQFETRVEVLKVINITYISNFLFCLGFLIVGFIVVSSKPTGRVQRLFAYFSFLAAILFGLGNLQLPADTSLLIRIPIIMIAFIARIMGPVIFILFFFNFPVKREFKRRTLFIICTIAANLALSVYLSFPRPNDGGTIDFSTLLNLFMGNFPLLFLAAGFGVFTHTYFKIVEPKRRKSLTPILISSIIGIAAYIYTLYVNLVTPFSIYINPVALVPGLLLFFVPAGFGYSIFRYKLMDMEIVLKKSLVYGIITAMIASLYVLVVFGTGNIIGEYFGHKQNQTLSLIALVIIAFVFDPLKRRIQDWVDKIFYLERQNYQKILLDFSRKLPLQVDLKQILNSVVTTISSTMHIEKVGVVLLDEQKGNLHIARNIDDSVLEVLSKPGFISNIEVRSEPILAANLSDEWHGNSDELKHELDILSSSGIELLVPVKLQDKLMGIINIGSKLSQKVYSQEDLNLLMTVASQTAIAVENSRMYEKEKTFTLMQEEMRLASKIQLDWLPKDPPDVPGFDIAGKMIPSELVGGDYYDFIKIDNQRLAISIGDVSGKGLSAAMLMANLHAVVRSQTFTNPIPAECMKQTNRLVFESSNEEMFITLFYGILNTKDLSFEYTNGGHNLPILVNSAQKAQLLDTEGLVIGINDNVKYGTGKMNFKKDDVLVLYTDGISEAFNDDNEIYGEQRLTELIKLVSHLGSRDIIERILEDISRFSSKQIAHDDMTLVVIKAV